MTCQTSRVSLLSACPWSVFTVQDGPGSGREEDREAAWETDETDGVQRDAQQRYGNRLT